MFANIFVDKYNPSLKIDLLPTHEPNVTSVRGESLPQNIQKHSNHMSRIRSYFAYVSASNIFILMTVPSTLLNLLKVASFYFSKTD